jgi:hypothetical protein
MVRVGVTRKNGFPFKASFLNNINSLQLIMSKAYDIELFLFSYDDIDFEKQTINGCFFENGEYIYKYTSFPDIINNLLYYNTRIDSQLKNEYGCKLLQEYFEPDKFTVYKMLFESDFKYKDWLIDSKSVDTVNTLIDYLDVHDTCILKACRSSGGDAVYKISRNSDMFIVYNKSIKTEYNLAEFKDFVEGLLKPSKFGYIINPIINSSTVNGEPFDIRIHCQRGKNGEFSYFFFPRIGSKTGITSNIHGGGVAMPPNPFFRLNYGEDAKKITSELTNFAKYFTTFWCNLVNPVNCSTLGIDIGIERKDNGYSFKLFELNAHCTNLPDIENIATLMNYYKYLMK